MGPSRNYALPGNRFWIAIYPIAMQYSRVLDPSESMLTVSVRPIFRFVLLVRIRLKTSTVRLSGEISSVVHKSHKIRRSYARSQCVFEICTSEGRHAETYYRDISRDSVLADHPLDNPFVEMSFVRQLQQVMRMLTSRRHGRTDASTVFSSIRAVC